MVNGQTLVVTPSVHLTKKRKVMMDIHSWTQAYSMYVAALISAEATSKSESAGLLAHMFNALQLAKDLGKGSGCSMTNHSENGQQPKT